MDGARWKTMFVVVVFLLPFSNIVANSFQQVSGVNETVQGNVSYEQDATATIDGQKAEPEKSDSDILMKDPQSITFPETIPDAFEDEATSIAAEEAVTTSSVLTNDTAPLQEKQTPQPLPFSSTTTDHKPPSHQETTTAAQPSSPPHSPTTPSPFHPPPPSSSPPSKGVKE